MTFNRPNTARPGSRTILSSDTFRPRLTSLAAAMRVLLLGMAIGVAALPQPARAQAAATALPAGDAVKTFNVPAGPLDAALDRFARSAGVNLSYDAVLIAGLTTKGLTGNHSVTSAISLLLAGTGVEAIAQAGGGYSLRKAPEVVRGTTPVAQTEPTLPAVRVTASSEPGPRDLPKPYAGGQVARGGQVGMLGNKDVMDTPFSQTTYTNKLIEDQQARTVQDVLNNDPSVMASTSSTPHDYQVIRGFGGYGIDGTRTLNGLVGMAPLYFPSSDYIERVEILKGPSALLNGMSLASAAVTGALGGSVNLVTKRATDEPITQLTTRYVSNSQIGAHLDVGRRTGANKEFGIRFNGSIDGGDTPVDTQHSKLGAGALNLDYSGERVRLSADLAHQAQKLDPNSPFLNARIASSLSSFPRAPSSDVSLAPPGSEYENKSTMGMVRGEVDIQENVTAYAAMGKQRAETYLNGLEKIKLLDSAGRFSVAPEIQRYSRDILSAQGGIRAKANTGPVDHALSLNLSRSELTFKRAEAEGSASTIGSIHNPVFPQLSSVADPGNPQKSSQVAVSSVGFADTLSLFDERVQFMAGVRYQKVDVENFNIKTGLQSSEYSSNAWTPAFGLVVKPWANVSLYANYIEDLRAGTTVGTMYANAGEVFSPYVSTQYEAGVKVDWGQVMTTLAIFQIAKPGSISIDDPAGGPPTLTQDGEERNRGIELNAYGELMPRLRLMGGLTLLDARLTKTQDGTLDGKRNDTSPKLRAVVGAEWDTPFMEGLTLTGRLTHNGNAIVSTASGVTIPSWTTLDLGARYTTKSPWNAKPVIVRFSVENALGKDYWAGTYASGFVYRGQPRTFRLSATVNF